MRQPSRVAVAGAAVCAVLASAASGLSAVRAPTVYPTPFYVLSAQLTGTQEVVRPKGAEQSSGSFTGRLTVKGGRATLAWQLRFVGLTGAPSSVQVSYGAPGKTGSVAIKLCPQPTCVSGLHGAYSWRRAARPKLLQALLHGLAYVNVRTQLNPRGEIRGQVRAASPAAAG
jgi:hypothetical protein